MLTMMISGISIQSADAVTLKYGAMTSGSDAGGFSNAFIGGTVIGSAATNDMSVTKVKFVWHHPDTSVVETTFDLASTPGGGSDCLTTATKYTGGVTNADVNDATNFICFSDESPVLDVIGDWGMQAFFCDDDDSCEEAEKIDIKAISFMVLPESAIGAIAIVGSSLGALGAFAAVRRNKATI